MISVRFLAARTCAAFAFALLATLAAGTPVAAQDCPPPQIECGPGGGGPNLPPGIGIFPYTGTYAADVAVTITWTDDDPVDATGFTILLNGQPAAGLFTHAASPGQITSTGTVPLLAGETKTLSASYCDIWSNCTTETVTYSAPPASVAVKAEADTGWVAGGSTSAARFRVVNTGTARTLYTLTPSCTNTGSCALPAGMTTVTVEGGDSTYVDVAFQAPASGSAVVRLTASAGSATSQGVTQVVAMATPPPGFPGDSASLLRSERSACITVSLAPGVAYECGDLRVVHGLPGVRELNRARAPVLVYNSYHARPYPVVAEQVTPRAGTAPDSIRATLSMGGAQVAQGAWPAWAAGTVRHVAVVADGASLETGIHPYTLEVRAHWNGGASETLRTRTGQMVIVNRGKSPFGAGWWLAGVEQVHHLGDTLKLWVGGDGSFRLYRGSSAAGRWGSEGFDRPDTLHLVGGEYRRTLAGGAQVWFDTAGYHARTVSTLGDTTHFRWNLLTRRLDRLVLPRTQATVVDSSYYVFEYTNNTNTADPRLSRVRAPWLTGFRDVQVITDTYARVTAITDPYLGGGTAAPMGTHRVQFGYNSNATNRLLMISRTDRRASVHQFAHAGNRMSASTRFPAAGDTIRHRFWPAENRGTGGSIRSDSLETRMDGPRGAFPNGMADRYLWRVNRWGAPIAVRVPTPSGWVWTTLEYGDARWPGLVTRTIAPNGFTTTATYDGRGNLSSQTAWNPYDDGRNATTTYQWDPRWDAVTRVVAPEGEVSIVQYDAAGRREWEQTGPSIARRVHYGYLPSNDASAPGRLSSVTLPGGVMETYEYDARGNLSATVSPLGFRTELRSDRIGRAAGSRSVVSTNPGRFRADTTIYDLLDRPLRTESWGPIDASGTVLVDSQRVVAVNEYDEEGNLLAVSRWSSPDPALIGAVTTRWQYDLVGRPVAELAPDVTPADTTDNPRDVTFHDRGGNPRWVRTRRFAAARALVGHDTLAYIRTEYDVAGRVTARHVPGVRYARRDDGIPEYYHPGSGLLCQPRGQFYDYLERNPFPAYSNDGDCGFLIPARTETYTYDWAGNVLTANNADGQVTRTYYPNGQLKTETQRIRTVDGSDFSAHVYTIGYTYDRNGRPREVQHPDSIAPAQNSVTRYGYRRGTGELETVTDPLGNAFSYAYNARGELASLARPGGLLETYGYDADGRITRLRLNNPAASNVPTRYPGPEIRSDSLRYAPGGQLLQRWSYTTYLDEAAYTYSALGHLRSVNGQSQSVSIYNSSSTVAHQTAEQMMTDALGNLRTGSSGSAVQASTSPPWVIGSAASQQNWSNRTSGYQAGTGRHVSSSEPSRQFLYHYDAAGNQDFLTQNYQYITPGICGSVQHASCEDRASFYSLDGRLIAADRRTRGSSSGVETEMGVTFEEYRYDALGRRIWVRSRKSCGTQAVRTMCNLSLVRRTVWDGDREFYEIQMPGWENTPVSTMEGDLAAPKEDFEGTQYYEEDRNPFFGRVAYTYGHGIDRPLSVVRMGYSDFAMQPFESKWRPHLAPFAILPLWDAHGNIDGAVVSVGGVVNGGRSRCETWQNKLHCIKIDWPESFFAYERPRYQRWHWHGTLLEDKRNETGTYYRRNRTYDPSTGRFTQEDPIGLAGGLNVYGFAAGDPISYADPYGLNPILLACASGVAVGWGVTRLLGGEYDRRSAAVDFALGCAGGAAGAGLLRYSRLRRVRHADELASAGRALSARAAAAGRETIRQEGDRILTLNRHASTGSRGSRAAHDFARAGLDAGDVAEAVARDIGDLSQLSQGFGSGSVRMGGHTIQYSRQTLESGETVVNFWIR